jgi:hypothetical protein
MEESARVFGSVAVGKQSLFDAVEWYCCNRAGIPEGCYRFNDE